MPDLEREAKFVMPDGAALPDLHLAVELQISHVELHATYWDTPERRLLRLGHTLRHRTAADGTEHRWTLKLASGHRSAGELLARREIHVNAPGDDVPDDVRALLRGVVRAESLQPIATITTARGRTVLADADGRPLVEIADDHVVASPTGADEFTFRQVEVEQVDPDSDELVDRVIGALEAVGARRDDRSKLTITLAGAAHDGHAAETGKVMTIIDLVRSALDAGTTRLLTNDVLLRVGDDAEALHQARVATRRLRSDLRNLRPVLDQQRAEHLRSELSWLAGLLGDVRDNDVLRDGLGDATSALDAEAGLGLAELLDGLAAEATPHRTALTAALGSDRYLELLDALTEAISAPPLADDVQPDKRARRLTADITRIAWRRASTAVKQLDPHPTPDELHDIRKRVKRARYAAELAVLVHGHKARDFAARLATVQDTLGDVHDAQVAEDWLRTAVARHTFTGAGGFTAGQLAERERGRAAANDARWRAEWVVAARPKRRAWLSP